MVSAGMWNCVISSTNAARVLSRPWTSGVPGSMSRTPSDMTLSASAVSLVSHHCRYCAEAATMALLSAAADPPTLRARQPGTPTAMSATVGSAATVARRMEGSVEVQRETLEVRSGGGKGGLAGNGLSAFQLVESGQHDTLHPPAACGGVHPIRWGSGASRQRIG